MLGRNVWGGGTGHVASNGGEHQDEEVWSYFVSLHLYVDCLQNSQTHLITPSRNFVEVW
jgi:hypothetical protein